MYTERLILIYIIGGYFISPIIINWAKDADSHYWFMPFLLWSALIVTAIWAVRSKDIDGI